MKEFDNAPGHEKNEFNEEMGNLKEPQQELTFIMPRLPLEKLKEIFEAQTNHHSLTSFQFISGPMNKDVFPSFINCLKSNPIHSINLSSTLLKSSSWNLLFNQLAAHATLQNLDLSKCLIKNDCIDALCNLVTRSHTLRKLDLSGHQMTENEQLLGALYESQSLEKVIGFTVLPGKVIEHLQRNGEYNKLASYLQAWEKEDDVSIERLNDWKAIFYTIVKKIKKDTGINVKRLNLFLANFFLLLGKTYHRLGLLDSADEYYERVLRCKEENLRLRYQSAVSQAELFYNLASANDNDGENLPSLEQNIQYLLKAKLCFDMALGFASTPDEKSYVNDLNHYCGIRLGENAINCGERVLDAESENYKFKRKYQKIGQ